MRIVACGGGTAGHATPALAVCREIRRLRPDAEILYIGAPGSIEERLSRGDAIPFVPVNISPLRRKVFFANLAVPFRAVMSILKASKAMKRHRTLAVFGSGGYSSWPACASAKRMGIPYFLEDGNAYPGLVTRLLAANATKIYTAYTETAGHLKVGDDRVVIAGVPVSDRFSEAGKEEARRELELDPHRFTILATGGSGGARNINKTIDQVKEKLLGEGFNLIWQTGKQWDTPIAVPSGMEHRLMIDRFYPPAVMALAVSAADVAVTRCGMMSLAEMAVAGKPAILVPFPYSAEGHQEKNAQAVAAAGGGKMILDREFTPETFFRALNEMSQPGVADAMSLAMKKIARPDAARIIAKDLIETIERRNA